MISYVGVTDGFVVSPAPTKLSILPSPFPVLVGSPVAYFALVSKGPVRGTLTGTVSFTDDGAPIPAAPISTSFWAWPSA